MDLKILSFNKILFKKDFNMVKVLILFMAGVLFAGTTMHILSAGNSFNRLEKEYIDRGYDYNREDLIEEYKERANRLFSSPESDGISLLIIIAMSISVIGTLFAEEKRKKTFEVLQVMPYTRYEIFFNKLLVALVAIALPFIINGLIMILAWAVSPTLKMFYSAGQVIKWILLFLYHQLPILGFTLLFGTLTANTISYIILTIIFLVFPLGFPTLIFWNLVEFGFSLPTTSFENILFKIMRYTPLGTIINPGASSYFLYILASLAMIIISKILFDKNKIERNGEVLEFENTEGFFKFGVAVCTALLMGVVFYWIFNDFISLSQAATILVMLLGYIVGGIAGYLMANFSIKAARSKA